VNLGSDGSQSRERGYEAAASDGPAMRVIVTGDDFGRSRAINHAILTAHREGILTSASLMVAAPHADEAVILARQNPSLAVGLHLTLSGGLCASPPSSIPHLVDGRGRFRATPGRAGLLYFFDRRTHRELAREISAQFRLFERTGLRLSHVDGHHHLHLHPTVLALLVPLAHRYGARGIRMVRDDMRMATRFQGVGLGTKLAWHLTFSLLTRAATPRVVGLATTERVYGLLQTGYMGTPYLLRVLEEASRQRPESPSAVEIYAHPGARFGDDLAALVSPQVKAEIDRLGLELTTYAELVTQTGLDLSTVER
jgi:hopanoid biosynthesis associated protein HpnK